MGVSSASLATGGLDIRWLGGVTSLDNGRFSGVHAAVGPAGWAVRCDDMDLDG